MREKITEDQIISLALGELNASDAELVRKVVMEDDELRKLYESYFDMVEGAKALPVIEAKPMVKARFDDWLSNEIANQESTRKGVKVFYLQILKYAVAASVFIAIGLFIGTRIGNSK